MMVPFTGISTRRPTFSAVVALIGALWLSACSGDEGPVVNNIAGTPTDGANTVEVIESETYVPAANNSTAATGVTAAKMPVAFQGRYAGSPEACSQKGDPEELIITPTALRYYESEGAIAKVETHSPTEVGVTAHYSGEGENWTATERLSLSEDGNRLVADGTTRVRCR